jgi:hypothetical protein
MGEVKPGHQVLRTAFGQSTNRYEGSWPYAHVQARTSAGQYTGHALVSDNEEVVCLVRITQVFRTIIPESLALRMM